jgi:hypothetical protein
MSETGGLAPFHLRSLSNNFPPASSRCTLDLFDKGVQLAQPAAAARALQSLYVLGSYNHGIRFWEAWSGICSRTSRHLTRVCLRVPRSQLESGSLIFPSKRLLAAAFHKKSNIFGIASSSSAPVTGPSIAFTHTLLKRRA